MTDTDTILWDEPPAPVYLDRSTLERYATCPFQGWSVEAGGVIDASPEAQSGSEAHRVIAEAVDGYARDGVPPREYMEGEGLMTRPDVQLDVLAALRPSIYAIDRFLTSRNPLDIIAYQGGQDERSGQMGWPLLPAIGERGAITPTSEIDLLMASAADTELHEIDFKSGHKMWTAGDVKNAFQFRMHAWLLFHNYPAMELLRVQVWMTRFNQRTPQVAFTRKMADDISGVLLEAVEYRRQSLASPEADTWPGRDKCSLCAAAPTCPRAMYPAKDLMPDPAKFAADTMVLQEVVSRNLKALRGYVDEHGEIEGATCFGLNAPKAARKPSAANYRFYTSPDGGEEAQE